MGATTLARVLFDEAHSEAWTIRSEIAAAMQPAHPADSSYARAAALLSERDFEVLSNVDGSLTRDALSQHDVLVIAHPSDPVWERTTGTGSPRFAPEEIEAIDEFVRAGGGLIVLGETEQEKYGNNVNDLLERFGLHLQNDTVQDYEHCVRAPSWILAELGDGGRGRDGDLLARVHEACLYRATTITSSNGARVLARSHATASVPGAPLIVTLAHGDGHVVVLGDSDLFGDDCIDELDHRALWLNLVFWAARAPEAAATDRRRRRPRRAAWATLRDETNALALLQARRRVAARRGACSAGAAPRRHDRRCSRAAGASLPAPGRLHRGGGRGPAGVGGRRVTASPTSRAPSSCSAPSIGARTRSSISCSSRCTSRTARRDTCFEALLVRVPWPDWIAELERTRYDNPKFVPVELVDATRGYDSECAVLFPETVSVRRAPGQQLRGDLLRPRGRAPAPRRRSGRADLLRLNLPPDAARAAAQPRGLPAGLHPLGPDPRPRPQPRRPAVRSVHDPPAGALLDVLARGAPLRPDRVHARRSSSRPAASSSPATSSTRSCSTACCASRSPGSRVRNYDGLGGQLLFAYLHRHGYLHWTDNQLTIEWERVGEGVSALHAEVGELYRTGIDRTKLQHWAAAHDLVAANVAPAIGSKWVASARDFTDVEDPRPYVDLVLDDEFPLSLFYTSLKAKLGA